MKRWIFCAGVFATATLWAAVLQAGPGQQGLGSDKVITQEGGTVSPAITPRKCPEGQVWSAREHECVPVTGSGVPEPQPGGGGGVVSKGTEEEHAGDGIVGE